MCSCGNTFDNCMFWNKVNKILSIESNRKSLKEVTSNFSPTPTKLIDRLYVKNFNNFILSGLRDNFINFVPIFKKYFNNLNENYLLLAEIILKITKKSVFLDASKHPNRIRFLKPLLGNKLKIIHLVKDGRGVYDSFIRYESKQPDKSDRSDKKRILSWKKINQIIEFEIAKLPKENVYFLAYEKLVNDTENQMRNIFNFVDVKYNSNYINFRDFEHHIIGNKMRLNGTSELYYDEKWKDSLNKHQLALFDALAGDLNRKYGFQ